MIEQVTKFQKVEESLSKSKGPFELFGLFLREDSPGKWDLLISADWTKFNKMASIKTIAEELRKELTDKEFINISRIIILDEDDEKIKSIRKAARIANGVAEISAFDFLGIAIKHAYLINS